MLVALNTNIETNAKGPTKVTDTKFQAQDNWLEQQDNLCLVSPNK